MNVFTIIVVVILLFFLVMAFRNNWVYNQRIKILDADMEKYNRMCSYSTMMLYFWVWDINKFIE